MAKQKGIIPIKGTLGGVNYYFLKGTPVARKAGGGFNGEDIKNKPSMQRVRENSHEFGHCSAANKIFREAIEPLTEGKLYPTFHSSLMSLFNELKNLDEVHPRGERKVSKGIVTKAGQAILVAHSFTPENTLSKRLPFEYEIDAETGVLHIKNLKTSLLQLPKGATHVAFRYGVLHIDFDTFDYELCEAPVVWIGTESTEKQQILTPVLATKSLPITIYVLGMRMYQEHQGVPYMLHSKGNVGVRVLGVEG